MKNLRIALFENKKLTIYKSKYRNNGNVSKLEGKDILYKDDKWVVDGKEYNINYFDGRYWINFNKKRQYVDFLVKETISIV